MKKLSLVMALLLVLLSLFGCTPSETGEQVEDKGFELDNDLVAELTEYFTRINSEADQDTVTLGMQVDSMKTGRQAFIVKSNPNDYFFACAYYDKEHDSERINYCCCDSYTWIGFNNADEIKEYYQDKKFVVAFQVNNSLMCENILLENGGSSTMQLYKKFNVKFENGTNTESAHNISKCFFYFHDTIKDLYYFSIELDDISYYTQPCIELDGNYYFCVCTSETDENGQTREYDLRVYLKPYYDELDGRMITGLYNYTNNYGRILHYGLFSVEDIANLIEN